MNRKFSSFVLLCTLMLSLTGCGHKSAKELAKLPLVDPLSIREVTEYYKEEMKVKSITQTTQAETDSVELRDINDNELAIVKKALSKVEGQLGATTYTETDGLTKQMFETVKIHLDDRSCGTGEIIKTGAIREMYIVDVKYSGRAKAEGKVKEEAKYLGVHGVFRRDENNLPYIDEKYVEDIEEAVAKQKETLKKQAEEGVQIVDDLELSNSMPKQEADGVTSDVINGDVNLKAYNNVLGSSLNEAALMPSLDMVFTPSSAGGKLGGYGIYAQGNTALSNFGFDRNKPQDVVIRYVFKSDIADNTKMKLENVYVRELNMDVSEELAKFDDVIFPEFVETELGKIVERADRVITNGDITGLSNGKVFYNLRNTIYWGHFKNNVNFNINSKIERYVEREGNYYLLELSTVSREDVRYDDVGEGVFKDTYLVVVEQQLLDNSFVIIDWMRTRRETVVEPTVNYTDGLDKRYSSLSLSDAVADDVKGPIKETLQTSYKYAMDRNWQGFYGMLDTDTALLSKTRRDNIYLTSKGWCQRRGSEKDYEYIGAVTDWLGGTSNQVELMTKEVIEYKGLDKAQVMVNYYLLSNFDDIWVIDEIKNISLEDIEGSSAIAQAKQEVEGYKDERDKIRENAIELTEEQKAQAKGN